MRYRDANFQDVYEMFTWLQEQLKIVLPRSIKEIDGAT
jgi:hypothetical protein